MLERRRVAARNILHGRFLKTVLIELLARRGKDRIALNGLLARVVAHGSNDRCF